MTPKVKKILLTLCIILIVVAVLSLSYMNIKTNVAGNDEVVADVTDNSTGHDEAAEAVIKNPDISAWLFIPGTVIDYPVCQTMDNDYYLTHNLEGEISKSGCIFLDYQSNIGDKNKVVYGHNLGSSSTEMFSTLTFFINSEWYDNHRIIKYTPVGAETETYKVFAALSFHTDNLTEFDYMQRTWDNDSEFSEWIDYIYEHSLYECDTNVTSDAQILTLSTCNRAYGNDNRFLLFAYKEGAT